MTRWVGVILLSCASALWPVCAIAASSAVISGSVIDADSRLPVAGAEIALRHSFSSFHMQSVKSDASGAFRFAIDEAGAYNVEAAAEGYYGTEDHVAQPPIKIDESDLGESSPAAERNITILLSRGSAIAGELKDGETQQPLEGFTVKLLRISWSRGRRLFANQGIGSTNEKGAFRVEAPSGDYLLEIWKVSTENHIVPVRQEDYSVKSPIPMRYPTIFWPMGDPDTLIPLTVRGGDFIVGTIPLSKVQMGRIRGKILLSQCAEGQPARVSFDMQPILDKPTSGDLSIPCGSDFTIANLSPGKYRIESIIGAGGSATVSLPSAGAENSVRMVVLEAPAPGGAQPRFGSTEVRIEEGTDRDLDMTFESPLNIAGKVECECADGWKEAIRGAQINPGPLQVIKAREISLPPEIGSVAKQSETVDAEGAFRIVGSFAGAVRVSVVPMPPGMVIKQVLYNGVAAGNTVAPDPHAASQSLTIILTDRPAHVTGTVSREGNPVAGAHVVVARWPLSMTDDFPEFDATESGAQGEFAMRLAAGTYRITSIDAADWGRSDVPGVVAHWIASGQEFTVADDERKVLPITQPAIQ